MPSSSIQNTAAIEEKCVNTIRGLALDAVKKANSGHSGTAMALAPLAHVLFTRVLRHDPKNPTWHNRDRFVLSAGHASMLLYATLHLTGYDISLDDIKNFRQWDSQTPGHPEVHHTPGVEVTTGPLGQGFANAVGMAMAEEHLRATCGEDAYNHNIFVLCSDGDLMEGISYEAASLAGHNKLSRLVAIYDDNRITIDGTTDLSFTEDVESRFNAQGWNVIKTEGISEDLDALEECLNQAKDNTDAPTIIILRTHIAFPSPKFIDTPAGHGAITDQDDIDATKKIMGLPTEPFFVDTDVINFYKECADRFVKDSSRTTTHTNEVFESITTGSTQWLEQARTRDLASYFVDEAGVSIAPSPGDSIATRVSCGHVLATIAPHFPSLLGGSADLSGNTGTKISSMEAFRPTQRSGRQLYFGIREHAMGSTAVGMALSYNLRPFIGTFFVFADYMRPSIRLASFSKAPVLFVFSHDSVGVGEDGPTHQPIEQLASLRAIPGLNVVRPADAYETAAAIEFHLAHADGPTALITTRQNVSTLSGTAEKAREGIAKGAYAFNDVENPDVVLVATGSEVQLALAACEELSQQSIAARVVSMPCVNRFTALSQSEKIKLLPAGVPVISVEAGTSFGWGSIADEHVSIDRFGASAPGDQVMEHLGITTQAVIDAAKRITRK